MFQNIFSLKLTYLGTANRNDETLNLTDAQFQAFQEAFELFDKDSEYQSAKDFSQKYMFFESFFISFYKNPVILYFGIYKIKPERRWHD